MCKYSGNGPHARGRRGRRDDPHRVTPGNRSVVATRARSVFRNGALSDLQAGNSVCLKLHRPSRRRLRNEKNVAVAD